MSELSTRDVADRLALDLAEARQRLEAPKDEAAAPCPWWKLLE